MSICGRGEGRQIKRVGVISERHKKRGHKKVMGIIKKGHSEEAYKESDKKDDEIFKKAQRHPCFVLGWPAFVLEETRAGKP